MDSGSWTDYTTPFTLLEGIHTISYHSTDYAGNTEEVKSITLYVDATPPTTTISIGKPQCTGYEHLVVNSNTPITLTATDPVVKEVASGVKQIIYTVNGQQSTVHKDTVTFTIPDTYPDGEITIEYYAVDNVLNQPLSPTRYMLILDHTPPDIDIYSPQNNHIINYNIAVMGKAEDKHFGSYTLS